MSDIEFHSQKASMQVKATEMGDDDSNDRTTLVASALVQGTYRYKVEQLISSRGFDIFIAVTVAANTLYIGIQTDLVARRGMNDHAELIDRGVDSCFCCIFLLEIGMKLYALRLSFFRLPDRWWNLIDCCVVTLQCLELVSAWTSSYALPKNFSILRILRVLRAIRLIRLVRLLRPLRILVLSILGSLQPLLWTVMLLVFVIYLMAVFLTQNVADLDSSDDSMSRMTEEEETDHRFLTKYYGTLPMAMLSLFQAVTGGCDWENMVDPLINRVSPFIGLGFSAYIAFALLALMNVVSGYFVQSTLDNTKRETEVYMVMLVRQVLSKLDLDNNGTITWAEFEHALGLKEMQEYFRTIDVDISDAKSLWNLLDVDSVGSIDAESLLNGCVRLQGPATALGQNLLLHQIGRLCGHTASLTAVETHCLEILELVKTKFSDPLAESDVV
jgi:hypothetical protein